MKLFMKGQERWSQDQIGIFIKTEAQIGSISINKFLVKNPLKIYNFTPGRNTRRKGLANSNPI